VQSFSQLAVSEPADGLNELVNVLLLRPVTIRPHATPDATFSDHIVHIVASSSQE